MDQPARNVMNDKLRLPILCVFVVLAVGIVAVSAYHFFGPQKQLPPAKMVSLADLVRQEKKDPSVLTDDQRKMLANIPASEKDRLATAQSFSLSRLQAQKPRTAH